MDDGGITVDDMRGSLLTLYIIGVGVKEGCDGQLSWGDLLGVRKGGGCIGECWIGGGENRGDVPFMCRIVPFKPFNGGALSFFSNKALIENPFECFTGVVGDGIEGLQILFGRNPLILF